MFKLFSQFFVESLSRQQQQCVGTESLKAAGSSLCYFNPHALTKHLLLSQFSITCSFSIGLLVASF